MLPLLLLTHIATSLAAPMQCDIARVGIIGGNYTVSEGGNPGSKVTYRCPWGQYPHPAYTRVCSQSGRWSQEKEKARCKDVSCPFPEMFEGGEYSPRKKLFRVGDVLDFECWAGFTRSGPENRTCQENGKWSGETVVCDDQAGKCPNPGIPIGSSKVGSGYEVEHQVKYECRTGLKMFGSNLRVCQENGRWSGTEPSCREWYTYDTPEEVAQSFSSSLSENLEVADPDKVHEDIVARRVKITRGGLMNIFLVIDASKSVGRDNFQTAKDAIIMFIEKVSSYDADPRYAFISYASQAKKLISITDPVSVEADTVIDRLTEFDYAEHDDKQGTNTRAALASVYSMLIQQELTDKKTFDKARNVILLMTDGKYNMGGDPTLEVTKIRELLNIGKNQSDLREDYLDVYVFGLGEDISQDEINGIASKKDKEKHAFHLKDADDMKRAFDEMIDETDAMDMCGLAKDHSDDNMEQYPWIAHISITRPGQTEGCKGSVVSNYYILTAAHCFRLDDQAHLINVKVGERTHNVEAIKRHPDYNPAAKQDKHIGFLYDYDVALIKVKEKEKIEFSSLVRPICIPCTKSASWALKMPAQGTTCIDHMKELLSKETIQALFIAEEDKDVLEPKQVIIKRDNKRNACLEDAKKVKQLEKVEDIREAVTDRFLCTGGIEPQVDPPTCKGDSGGPLIIQRSKRYIQVGVISWGTVDHCVRGKRIKKPVPAHARDFHFSIETVRPWLEVELKNELIFLPD